VSYSKEVGEVSARLRSAGEVPSVTYPSGTHVVFTAPGSATNGQYGLFEWNMSGTRGGADPHFHKTFSESFYVMEGTVRLRPWRPGSIRSSLIGTEQLGHDVFVGSRTRPPSGNPFVVCREGSFDLGFF